MKESPGGSPHTGSASRVRFAGLACLVVIAGVQVGRLAVFMIDRSQVWGAAVARIDADHECLASYVRAGELARTQPAGLYNPGWYARGPQVEGPPTHVVGLSEAMGDPFMYPPAFLPIAGLLAQPGSMAATRVAFFFAQLLILGLLVWRVTGASTNAPARSAAFLAFVASTPVLFTLQFGQVHLLVLMVAVAGMAAVQSGRTRLGAALIAASASVKIFPAILVVVLVAGRRYGAAVWTLGFCVLFAAVALVLYGATPFAAFAGAQAGELVTGDAFAPFRGSSRFALQNLAAGGLWEKVRLLVGVDGATAGAASPPAAVLRGVCAAAAVTLAILAGRRPGTYAQDVTTWAGLVTLSSLTGAYLPVEYGMAGVLLVGMLFLGTTAFSLSRAQAVAIGLGWLFLQAAPLFRQLRLGRPDLLFPALLGLSAQLTAVAVLVWASSGARLGREPERPPAS